MPELPEVEVRLRYLQRTALGKRIARVIVTAPNIIKTPAARRFASLLRGRALVKANRRGKYLIIDLDNGRKLILHFGMGGDLLHYQAAKDRPGYTRIEFILSDGWRLAFTCPRKICRVMLVDDETIVPALRVMGPEPLSNGWSRSYLGRVIEESPRRQIKPLLMDQARVAGVGNIYADQILFQARVRPDRLASTLTPLEIQRLHGETRRVLRRALREAEDEEFPEYFLASLSRRRAGCPECAGLIEKKTIGGRTSHFCPRCQV
jgi:formamidopyrimidine-DNA glycosylase